MATKHAACLPEDVDLGDTWLGSLGKQEKSPTGKKPLVSTSNSHPEGKVKLQGLSNNGPPICSRKYKQGVRKDMLCEEWVTNLDRWTHFGF